MRSIRYVASLTLWIIGLGLVVEAGSGATVPLDLLTIFVGLQGMQGKLMLGMFVGSFVAIMLAMEVWPPDYDPMN